MEESDALAPDGALLTDLEHKAPVAGQSAVAAGYAQDPAGANSTQTPHLAGDRVRTVPYGALAEERARRKELQRALQESAATRQQLQGRLDMLLEMAGRQAVSGPQNGDHETASSVASDRPVPEAAPDGRDADQFQADPSAVAADSAFRTQVLQSVRSYTAARPDFMDAYRHAREARIAELSALGYGADEAVTITFDNELELIRNAYATGRNPAQVIYDFAMQRGYRAANAAGPRLGARPQTPVGGPVEGRRTITEAEKIALAARGQAGAKSLSSMGGGSTGTLSLEALAGMSDEEFAETTKGDRWQRLLRG